MANVVGLSVLAAALAFAAPASAQVIGGGGGATSSNPGGVLTWETGNRDNLDKFGREFDNRRLRGNSTSTENAATGIAECLARRAAGKASGLLGGELAGDPDYKRVGEALSGRMRNCVAATAGAASARAISGALAEQLVLSQAPQVADRAADVSADAVRGFLGELSGMVTIDKIAGCLAVYSPGLVYRMLKTPAGTQLEADALQALYRESPECNTATPPAQFPAELQRGLLATALYEWINRKS